MKRPCIIEFSGLPNSGKTTLLRNVDKICKNAGVKATIVWEPAELLPDVIPKGVVEQNLWITLETIQRCLEVRFTSDTDFILLDRGFYNQLFWAELYKDKDAKYSEYVTKLLKEFSEMYQVQPDYLYVIDVSVDEAIKRRMLERRGKVTFSKEDFLINYKKRFEVFYQNVDTPVIYLDTTNLTRDEVANNVFIKLMSL